MAAIKRALISVSDKTGIIDLAKELSGLGVEILSTGGTAGAIKGAGIDVKDVSEHTGFPEMMDGRLKTLHPKVHGGLLMRRDNPKDKEETEANGIVPIDMVVVNLYPFEQTVSKPDVTFEDAIENIDIGGPTMIRAASKNYKDVAVVVDPADYSKVLDEMKSGGGEVSADTKLYLAKKVFSHTAQYDTLISNYLNAQGGASETLPENFNMSYRKVSDVRYGENPHQKAAVYREPVNDGLSLVDAKILQGKAMSFNNYLDSSAVIDLAKEYMAYTDMPTAVIVKHNNPCGIASADRLSEAYRIAFETDPISAFGGVIHLNGIVDEATAKEILGLFCEIIIAPGFDAAALKLLAEKPNIRLLELDISKVISGFEMRKIQGGLLLQERDLGMVGDLKACEVVTKRKPTEAEYEAMAYAWRVCKHMKSNAIIYAAKDRTLGIGCGQTSRVDSARLAAMKAANYDISLKGSAVASDAFFPARDGIDTVAEAGATSIIQPGGSIKDKDTIAACDEHDVAMIFTGMRHFRH